MMQDEYKTIEPMPLVYGGPSPKEKWRLLAIGYGCGIGTAGFVALTVWGLVAFL